MFRKIRDLLGKLVEVKQSPENADVLYLEIGKHRWVWNHGTYAFCYKWKT